MKKRIIRALTVATLLAVVLPACSIWGGMVGEDDDCGLKPVGSPEAGFRIGPARVAASCASQVEVDGRTYSVGVGRWLDEDALVLEEYGPITRSNTHVSEPVAFALDGVDPRQFLVMRGGGQDNLGEMGPFMVLWGDVQGQPDGICRYADPADRQYPGDECPLSAGRTYDVEMVIACGLEAAMGPYGGEYWYVVDPPAAPASGAPYPSMYLDLDYGTIELLDDDTLRYESEGGATLMLTRSTDPEDEDHVCPRPAGY